MPIKEILNKTREGQATSLTIWNKILQVILLFALGMLLGLIAKYSDTFPSGGLVRNLWSIIKDITTGLGVWILLATIIAVWSSTPEMGAVKVLVFFIGMLLTYYIYSAKLFGFFPTHYFLRWGLIAAASPLAAYIVWFGGGEGLFAALCAALPIGFLTAQGYSFFYTFGIVPGFDLLSAIALFFILPRSKYQHLKILPFALGIMVLLRNFDVVNYLIGNIIKN